MRDNISAVLEGLHINEISKLELMNQNKAKYQYVLDNKDKFIKDKIDKAITDTLILRWIKGRNWEGGLGNGKDVNNMWESLMDKYSIDADVIYDKFQRLCDFWESEFKKAKIDEGKKNTSGGEIIDELTFGNIKVTYESYWHSFLQKRLVITAGSGILATLPHIDNDKEFKKYWKETKNYLDSLDTSGGEVGYYKYQNLHPEVKKELVKILNKYKNTLVTKKYDPVSGKIIEGSVDTKVLLSKMNTKELIDYAVSLGVNKKDLYGTSKDALIYLIGQVQKNGNKQESYDVYRIVDVGDFSKDKMDVGTLKGSILDIKKKASQKYGKVKSVDYLNKEIIVEGRAIIEALVPKGPVNNTPFKEGQTLTLKKDVYYTYLDTLFDYLECNMNVVDSLRDFVGNAKPVIVRNNVMYVIPKGTKIILDTFAPGRDDVFVKVWGVKIPLTFFPDKTKGEIYWEDPEVEDWVG